MKVLLNFFVDLCLLRSVPQQLPASTVLFVLALIANVGIGLLLAGEARSSMSVASLESLLDSAMLLGFLYGALLLKKSTPRFIQAGTALMGSIALLNLIAIPLLSFSVPSGGEPVGSESALLLLFILVIWSMVVIGHILRHVLDTTFATGIALGLAYTFFSYAVLSSLFPVG